MKYALDRRSRFRYLPLFLIAAIVAIYLLTPQFLISHTRDAVYPDQNTPAEQLALPLSSGQATPISSDATFASSKSRPSPNPETVATPPPPAATRPGFHIVIAHYKEEPYFIRTWIDDLRQIPYIQELGLLISIYTKGPSPDTEAIKEATGADHVIKAPNVGREGGTYLHYILENYEDPPLFTLFAQSYLKMAQQEISGPTEGHLKDWLDTRLREKFNKQTGFMSLDRKHDICYCGHCTDMDRDDFYPLWSQLYTLINGEVCQRHEGHIMSFNGHFIVSRKRLLSQPRHIYEYLQELVNAPEDSWIHTEPEPKWFDKDKGRSIPSNPKFGHTLERLWHSLFKCDRPEQVTGCQIVGMKAEGPGGCSCQD